MRFEPFVTLGTIKRHPDGFGFLLPDDKSIEDVYIPKHSMLGIMTNDKVHVRVHKDHKANRFYGDIIRIEKRANEKVFGSFHSKKDGSGYLQDKENHWGEDLRIPASLCKEAKNGDLVQAKITAYPGDPRGFVGEILEVIGDATDPLLDTRRAMLLHSIVEGFSKKTLSEIKGLTPEVSPEDIKSRKDLRHLDLITIDGVTAKDFDDAIYVETTTKGFHLWVAIADVSHYVKEGSSLDKDAYEKGNSSYFPMFVEPMLPEILSNELCSLKPKVDRLCMVAEIWTDFKGNINKTDFYEAVMNSKARVTYAEAQEAIDGECPKEIKHVESAILRAADFAKVLMAKRFREGSLELDIPETQVIIDESGMPIDIIRSERLFAHQVIEEMMLIANIAVATFLSSKEIPAIYRIHERPEAEKIDMLQKFLTSFGSDIKMGEKSLQKKISKVLQKFAGKTEGDILSRLTLRSMKQAAYSVDNVGHFGLNFTHYSHFTSPIRRYPDLIVHRLLKVFCPSQHTYKLVAEEDLRSMATHLSATEQRSVKAERFLTGIKRARFINSFLGDEFEGSITSITKFGVFVGLREYDVDGLIRVEDLGDDYFEFIEDRLELVGKKSKFCYKLGMPLQIIVSGVNVELGQIDFILAKNKDKKKDETTKKKPIGKHSKERKKTKKDRKRTGKSRVSKSRRKNKS